MSWVLSLFSSIFFFFNLFLELLAAYLSSQVPTCGFIVMPGSRSPGIVLLISPYVFVQPLIEEMLVLPFIY